MVEYAFYSVDGSEPDFDSLINASALAFDVEATGINLGVNMPYGFSVGCDINKAYYASADHPWFRAVLGDESKLKVAHNAKFDRSMMKKAGFEINNLYCTMIAAHLLELDYLSLKTIMELPPYKTEIVAFGDLPNGFRDFTVQDMANFTCPHTISAIRLANDLNERMNRLKLLDVFWSIEMPLVPVLSDMELNGVAVDRGTLSGLGEAFDKQIDVLNEGLQYWGGTKGVNYNSSEQAGDVLFEKLGIPPSWKTTTKDKPSVDGKYLGTIKSLHPILPIYLLYKHLKKLRTTYTAGLSKMLIGDRIYGSFNQTRTETSRLSSTDPALQNIPQRTELGRRIRTAFIAPKGKSLVKADYDLIELKMAGHRSQDPDLLAAFRAGRDIHAETAVRAYSDIKRRPEGKTLDFKLIYGGGTRKEIDLLRKLFPRYFEWVWETSKALHETLYVRTLGGRIRTLPELDPTIYPAWMVKHAERQAISTIVQGSSAEVVKIGMRRVWEKLKHPDIKMVLQVHDEVVYEVPDDLVMDVAHIMKKEMRYDELSIPFTVTVSTGKNWGQMEKVL